MLGVDHVNYIMLTCMVLECFGLACFSQVQSEVMLQVNRRLEDDTTVISAIRIACFQFPKVFDKFQYYCNNLSYSIVH